MIEASVVVYKIYKFEEARQPNFVKNWENFKSKMTDHSVDPQIHMIDSRMCTTDTRPTGLGTGEKDFE